MPSLMHSVVEFYYSHICSHWFSGRVYPLLISRRGSVVYINKPSQGQKEGDEACMKSEGLDQTARPRSLILAFAFPQYSLHCRTFLHADCRGSDQTGRMRRLVRAWSVCIVGEVHFCVMTPNCSINFTYSRRCSFRLLTRTFDTRRDDFNGTNGK